MSIVLVGPNTSGKTTFLDVVSFLGTLDSEAAGYPSRVVSAPLRTADFLPIPLPCLEFV